MGKTSQRKGADGERELAQALRLLLDVEVERTSYAQSGERLEFDLNIPSLGIEVKRHKAFTDATLEMFWQQTVDQSKACGVTGVLAFRPDQQVWRVIVPGGWEDDDGVMHLVPDLVFTQTLYLPGFVAWYNRNFANKTAEVVENHG